jgi:hypothetical protein
MPIAEPQVINCARIKLFNFRNSKKMKSSVLSIALVLAVVLTTQGVFASGYPLSNSFALLPIGSLDTGSTLGAKPSASGGSLIILHGNLVSFDAAYGRNFFDINWNTRTESGFDHFEVERSLDGVNFKKVGEIKALDLSSVEENYSFRDNIRPVVARKNDLYYRLKQVDPNGSFTYSKVLIARMYNTAGVAAMSVTPDPVINDILVNVQLKENAFVVMKVKDREGNELMRKSAHGVDGLNTYQLDDTHQLQAGEYELEVIINSEERMVVKLIKG